MRAVGGDLDRVTNIPLTLPSPQGEGTLRLYILINSSYRG